MRSNIKVALWLLLGVVALALGGCSSGKCDDVCHKFNQCQVKERNHQVDCVNFCPNVEDFQTRAGAQGCAAKFEAHLDCWERASAQICDAKSEVCLASGAEWLDCLSAYCAQPANAKDVACIEGTDAAPATPAFAPFCGT